MFSRQLHESLDACRPGSDDLAHPELTEARAELEKDAALRKQFARIEQFDRGVAAAMHDVPLPEGLRERLLAKLADDVASVTSPEVVSVDAPGIPPSVAPRRRFLMATAGALALAACAMIAVAIRWNDGGEDWRPGPVAGIAAQSFDDYASRFEGAKTGEAPSYPLSQHVVHDRRPARIDVRDLAGCSGVAYRVQSRQRVPGVLFVLNPRSKLQGFPARPPGSPQANTGGHISACWREGNRLYILAYAGAAKDYRGFLSPTGPVAMLRQDFVY
jgi:hypothetical protein